MVLVYWDRFEHFTDICIISCTFLPTLSAFTFFVMIETNMSYYEKGSLTDG